MKKVLFVTYFWPPSGKASAHWPLKIIKHISAYGVEPYVLTVEEETFEQKDESRLAEVDPALPVFRSKAFEPFDIYRRFIGKKKGEKLSASETISKTNKSLTHRISVWIRMNLFIPDARIGWYPSAVNKGKEIIRDHHIDAVVTIGPPHSAHLIGLKLSSETGVKHIPVFIDPWTDIVYYRDFKRNYLTVSLDNFLEKKVLTGSSAAVFVTDTTKNDYNTKYPSIKKKSHVLYWGYDNDAFESVINEEDKLSSLQSSNLSAASLQGTVAVEEDYILHAGNIFDYQNIPAFWHNLKSHIDKGMKIKLKFAGSVSPEIISAIEAAGLKEHTTYEGFLPYNDVIRLMLKAKYLLVCATEPRHLPGKLFEYLRAGKPIIAFGDDNVEVKEILEKSNAGMLFQYTETAEMFFQKADSFHTDMNYIKRFDRQKIASELSKIIYELK